MGRVVLKILAGLLVILVGLVLYINFADLNRYRPQIESLVTDSVGREFKIAGDLQLHIGLPSRLEATEVSLANSSWGSEPNMLEIGELVAYVAPLSLLSSEAIRIESFDMHDVKVLQELNSEGESNWELSQPDEGEQATGTSDGTSGDTTATLPVMVFAAEITNLVFTQRQADIDDRSISIAEFQMKPGSADKIDLHLQGMVLKLPLLLDGHIGSTEQLTTLGETNIELAGTLGELSLQLEAQIANLEELSGITLDVSLSADDIATIGKMEVLPETLTGPLQLSAELKQVAPGVVEAQFEGTLADASAKGEFSLDNNVIDLDSHISTLADIGRLLDVQGLPAEPLKLKARLKLAGDTTEVQELSASTAGTELSGSVVIDAQNEKTTADIQIKSENLAALEARLPQLPLTASSTISLRPELVELTSLDLRIGDSDLRGSVALGTGERKSVKADLQSKRFVLTPFLADEDESGENASTADAKTAQSAPEATGTADASQQQPAAPRYVFTEEPLPFELLQSSDADIKVQVQELVNEAIVRKDVLIEATLKEGDLIADIDFETHQKGKASASVKLLTENETATLKTALMARDLRLNLISGDVEDYTQIPPTSATIELASSGSSPRQLAANSSGEILLTQGSGRMDNQLLERFSGDILAQLATALNPAAKAEPYSRYECSIVVVSIKEGLASLDTTILQGEKVMIVAGGHIDLTTEKLNLEFNTKPRQGVGITADAFVTPFVALKGTLASPSIGLNEKGTLITAGAAAATGGLSLILQTALDRATAAINHCEETLPKHPHPPFKNV